MTDMDALEALVGEWTAEAVDPGTGEPVRGEMTVEWLGGGGYLVQRTTMENPVFPRTLAMFGPDRSGERIVQHYFDSRGVARRYAMTLEADAWTLERDGVQRYVGRFEDDDTIRGAWEWFRDGAWQHDFELDYRRSVAP